MRERAQRRALADHTLPKYRSVIREHFGLERHHEIELLYNPRLLCERLAIESVRRRRLATLKGTQAAKLSSGHIDTLELLQLASPAGISVIYDIGANVGTWSLLAKSLIPDVRIEAFEPLPKHQTEFLRNFTGSADVTLHSVALGSDNATERFTLQIFQMPPASCSRMRRAGRISVCARCSGCRSSRGSAGRLSTGQAASPA